MGPSLEENRSTFLSNAGIGQENTLLTTTRKNRRCRIKDDNDEESNVNIYSNLLDNELETNQENADLKKISTNKKKKAFAENATRRKSCVLEVDAEGSFGNADDHHISDQQADIELAKDDQLAANFNTSVRSFLKNKPHSLKSEAGVIKQIYVENFMCHRKLTVTLNRNVNFIQGQNGSGKSAILAAIQICLGANARRTHRARNLKALVRKDGTNSSAKVRVTLLNREDDGYKYDVYGDEIAVERVISLTGGFNGYRMLDCNGKEQSRLKQDLDEMLDTFNIQVENPVAVLDQEEAKKFIMGKPEDKYNFFMKATELERVDQTYASTIDSVMEMTELNDRVREELKQKWDQVDILKKKYEEHLELDKIEGKLQQMKVKYAWSFYHSADEEHRKCLKSMAVFQEKAVKKEQELSQVEESLSNPSNEHEQQRRRLDSLLKEAQQQAALMKDLQEQLQQVQSPYKAAERELKSVNREQTRVEKQLSAARKRLQTARDQIIEQAGATQSEEARLTATLKKAEEDLVIAQEKVPQLRQAVTSALRSYEELEPNVLDSRSKVNKLSNQVQGVGGTIRELESKSGDSVVVWGRNVPKVQQMISDAKGRLQGPVVGPIGSFIKISPGKEEYASIAELAIGGGTMDRFIVTCDHDRSVIQDIRKRAGCTSDCGIFQLPPNARYKVPAPPYCDGIETIASVLKVENDLVFNCLVDNAKIDQIVIARDKKLSEDVLLGKNGSDYFIKDRNVTTVYFLPQGDNWTVRYGSLSIFSNERNLKQTIGVDRSGALIAAKRERQMLQEALKVAQKEDDRLNYEHSKYQKGWNKTKKTLQQTEALISDLMARIESTKNVIETSANVTIDTIEYEEDVRAAEEDVASLREAEDKLRAQLEKALPIIDELKSKLDDCRVRNRRILEDIEHAEADLIQHLESVSQQKDVLEKKRQKVEKFLVMMKKYQGKVDETTADRDEALLSARKLDFRLKLREKLSQYEGNGLSSEEELLIDSTDDDLRNIEIPKKDEDPPFYEVRIKKLENKLEAERQKKKLAKEDPAVAYAKYVRARDDLNAKANMVKDLEEHIYLLRADLSERKKRWKQFRDHLVRTTGTVFTRMLSINQCSGDLIFNHKTKTLDVCVHKITSNSQGVSQDVKSLSGGERSYATMCLLVALGETLETPFRILDEFDVFLDTEARTLTIHVLIRMAKCMEHRQFIFITPQDLSSIQPADKLQIWKLTPPQRHVNAGGLSQQTLDFAPV